MATVYDIITARIMEELEQGTVPWQRPWNSTSGMPRNPLSQKAHRGINVWVLASAGTGVLQPHAGRRPCGAQSLPADSDQTPQRRRDSAED